MRPVQGVVMVDDHLFLVGLLFFWNQRHAAFRTITGFITNNFGVHGAGVLFFAFTALLHIFIL